MAIDSATKRWAVMGVGRPYMRSVFPVAAKNGAWRASVGHVYPVASFGAAAPVVAMIQFGRRRRFIGVR